MVATRSRKQNCLVTGGSGFLGRHLVSQLLETGKCNVTVFDIRDYGDSRVKCIVGDLRKLEDVTKACAGTHSLPYKSDVIAVPLLSGQLHGMAEAAG